LGISPVTALPRNSDRGSVAMTEKTLITAVLTLGVLIFGMVLVARDTRDWVERFFNNGKKGKR
jgi:hypothetical protein